MILHRAFQGVAHDLYHLHRQFSLYTALERNFILFSLWKRYRWYSGTVFTTLYFSGSYNVPLLLPLVYHLSFIPLSF